MIISLNLTEANAAWLNKFNTSTQKAIGKKIGKSMIVNILLFNARGSELGLKATIITEMQAASKRKALVQYSKKVLAIGKKR